MISFAHWVYFLPRDGVHSVGYAVARCLSVCPSE